MDLGVGCLTKFGGVLRQFVVDDKGCVMIGAFGLPQHRYTPPLPSPPPPAELRSPSRISEHFAHGFPE